MQVKMSFFRLIANVLQRYLNVLMNYSEKYKGYSTSCNNGTKEFKLINVVIDHPINQVKQK